MTCKPVPIEVEKTLHQSGWVELVINTNAPFIWDSMLSLADKFMVDASQIDRIITGNPMPDKSAHDYVDKFKAAHTSFSKFKGLSEEKGHFTLSYHSKRLEGPTQVIFWNQSPYLFIEVPDAVYERKQEKGILDYLAWIQSLRDLKPEIRI